MNRGRGAVSSAFIKIPLEMPFKGGSLPGQLHEKKKHFTFLWKIVLSI
jgi:hypothetical protein